MAKNKTTKHLLINEIENAIDSLGKALAFLSEVEQNPFNWKWFIIALHHATYSFMLLALQNTDLSAIWKEPVKRKENGLIDISDPRNKLISFMEAFERIQDPNRMSGYVNSRAFSAKPYHRESMKRLNNELRNQFLHYRPTIWSIHKEFIIKNSLPALEIIKFLAFESERITFFENFQIKSTQTYLDAIRFILKNYETQLANKKIS